jgi:membrane protein
MLRNSQSNVLTWVQSKSAKGDLKPGTMILRFFKLLRLAVWRAFTHDAFGVAKGAAYSSIISLFPALLVVAAILAASHKTAAFVREISYAVGRIFPPGASQTAVSYFDSTQERPVRVLVTTSFLTLWTASGVMISWMEGFRNAYQLPKTWGIVKERLIAFGLVIMAGLPLAFATMLVAFGAQIEHWIIYRAAGNLQWYILVLWVTVRWVIAILTSIAVIALVYHHAVPRTLRWHSVMPGAILATAIWFPATMGFGWYVSHFAEYSLLYGSLATAIVLLVWMYIISIIVLIGAEFNALLYPRTVSLPKPAEPIQNGTQVKVG